MQRKKSMGKTQAKKNQEIKEAQEAFKKNPDRENWSAEELCEKMTVVELKLAYIAILNQAKTASPGMTKGEAEQLIQRIDNPINWAQYHMQSPIESMPESMKSENTMPGRYF
jgi:hypothetical protein